MADYKELYESLSRVIPSLESENKRLSEENKALMAQRRQWEEDKVKQQGMIQQLLDTKNREHNEILEENQKLREQLRVARSM